MLEGFMRGRTAKFRDTVAQYARSKQDLPLNRMQIPTARFYDKSFIENLFVSHGRIPVTIDTTTFNGRIAVVTKEGECWFGNISFFDKLSNLYLRITSEEVSELEALE